MLELPESLSEEVEESDACSLFSSEEVVRDEAAKDATRVQGLESVDD